VARFFNDLIQRHRHGLKLRFDIVRRN